MMIIINGKDSREYQEYLDQLFRLRYKIFVEGRGWSLPTKNGLEIDQYDDEQAIYFLDVNDDDIIEGTVRITPTEKSSLTADYFPHLIENGQPPRSNTVYEATRYIVRPVKKSRDQNLIVKARIFSAVTKWCIENDIQSIQTVIDSNTLPTFIEFNPEVRPMGLSSPYGGGRNTRGGGDCMVIRWPVSQKILDRICAYEDPKPYHNISDIGLVSLGNTADMIH